MHTFTELVERVGPTVAVFASYFTSTTKRVCCKWSKEKRYVFDGEDGGI